MKSTKDTLVNLHPKLLADTLISGLAWPVTCYLLPVFLLDFTHLFGINNAIP